MDTVLGKTDKLGRTIMHEHLTIDLSAKKDADANLNDDEAMIEDMKTLKAHGIDTIADVTNLGMGRDIARMIAISKRSGINVVAATGFYKTPFFPKMVYEKNVEELSTFMINEIVNGIDKTEVKARIIGEIGTSQDGFTDEEKKVFQAAAYAHKTTGVPITTHTTLGKLGLKQIELFEKNGVDLEKVIIGHVDLNPDIDYYLKILEKGCYIGFDTIGKNSYQPDTLRASNLCKLIERGYASRIVLSLDITRKSQLKKYGGYGRSYILESFVPMLLRSGINQKDIDMMMIENPRRIFGGR